MQLRTAIIGLGNQSEKNYVPAIKDVELAQLIAVCDVDHEKTEQIASQLSVNGYTSYRELISTEELDFVIVVTPHDVYHEIIECAQKNNIHVLKEKPFARNLREGYIFQELGRRSNIQIMTTLQRRFNPVYLEFFRFINEIGELIFIEGKYTLTIDEKNTGWRSDKIKAGGGCLIDMGYHIADMIIWYFGLPDKLMAEFNNNSAPENTASILFGYEKGLTGSLLISRCFPPKTEFMKILGSRGVIEIEQNCIRRIKDNGVITEFSIKGDSSVLATNRQIDYFCRVIKGEVENIGNPEYHLQHMKFLTACYESKKKGSYVNPNILK